jgi:Concanavalin A-like lectin/glucanases superfamily
MRITKGTGIYSGTTMVVPTQPLTPTTSTSLLLNFTNGGIIDQHSSNDAETVGNAILNTSIVKYGTASMAFDGTGDYLAFKTGPNPNFALGSGDWTVEMWMYPTSVAATNTVFDIYDGNSAGRFLVQLNTNSTIGFYGASAATRTISTGTVTLNSWNHVALCKSGSSTRIFINGVQVNTTYTDTNTYTCTSNAIYLAANGANGLANFFGYMDDFRITKGFARYTANFTPPTTGFLGQ